MRIEGLVHRPAFTEGFARHHRALTVVLSLILFFDLVLILFDAPAGAPLSASHMHRAAEPCPAPARVGVFCRFHADLRLTATGTCTG